MVVVVADHRPHEAQLVGDRTDVRQQLADFHPALAMRTEAKRRTHQQIGLAAGLKTLDLLRMLLAAALCEFGLRVEQVDLARPAVLHQENDGLGPGRKMPRARRQIGPAETVFRSSQFPREQMRECQRAEPHRRAFEKRPA